MKTVLKETEIEFEEKKSKFIGYIKPINSIKEAENFIKTIKTKRLLNVAFKYQKHLAKN